MIWSAKVQSVGLCAIKVGRKRRPYDRGYLFFANHSIFRQPLYFGGQPVYYFWAAIVFWGQPLYVVFPRGVSQYRCMPRLSAWTFIISFQVRKTAQLQLQLQPQSRCSTLKSYITIFSQKNACWVPSKLRGVRNTRQPRVLLYPYRVVSSTPQRGLWGQNARRPQKRRCGGQGCTEFDGVCIPHTPGEVFQARLLDNQEGASDDSADSANSADSADTERYVFGKLLARCFQRRPVWQQQYIPAADISTMGKRPRGV